MFMLSGLLRNAESWQSVVGVERHETGARE